MGTDCDRDRFCESTCGNESLCGEGFLDRALFDMDIILVGGNVAKAPTTCEHLRPEIADKLDFLSLGFFLANKN